MRIVAFLRDMFGPLRTWEDATRQRGLIPVLCDWEHYYAIDAAGRPVRACWTDWRDLTEETNPRMRHLVLVQAAFRYPELQRLHPVRRHDDPDCPRCGGAGVLTGSRRTCACGGAGWVPAEVARELLEP
jgi:hypothetical protein